MKLLLTIFPLLLASTAYSQFINPGFEEWEWITIAQPYENPVGWKTNNNNYNAGLANTTVTKGTSSSGLHARIRSASWGIDATGSGVLNQRISTHHLQKIDFIAKCDSLFQTGQCIVRLYGQSWDDLLYLDTMTAEDPEWRLHSIPILSEWAQSRDSITLEFIAKGGIDMWDEQEDGYSIFLVDSVIADYMTSTGDLYSNTEMKIYPNPSTGTIHFLSNPAIEFKSIEIISLKGQVVLKKIFSDQLDVSHLPDGMYVARMNNGKYLHSQLFVLRR